MYRLVQLPLHLIIGPKEREDQSGREAKHDGARYENLVLELLLQRYQVGPSADQRQPRGVQKNVAEGAHLLPRDHGRLDLFA